MILFAVIESIIENSEMKEKRLKDNVDFIDGDFSKVAPTLLLVMKKTILVVWFKRGKRSIQKWIVTPLAKMNETSNMK